ncbi:hypothetical protein [Mobilicoccus pelagius]|uniref:Secreted protein n=1 Tax=Mobilicoccus pelagius NBRC 104925 TaxID=1089455 RepID=H5UUG3_9MICO|nr:hypothetical protein [Mobilicoccus pelagius]GAB49371.1 hypothetical protein MOPEL_129_00140 [Mobilicoccus pelagius NBRC 104925]
MRMKRSAVALAATCLAMVGTSVVGVNDAEAATSAKTNGCFAWWGGRVSDDRCQPATATGYYQLRAACPNQPDRESASVYIKKGSRVDGWARVGCVGNVQSAFIRFRG